MEQKMDGKHNAGKEIASSSTPPPPLSESFVRAVWRLLHLRVYVYLKDGSVFSGIFLTVSPEKNIVLKKAKRTKSGGSRSNVASGDVVEMLVIDSGDIVKVVSESEETVLSFDDAAENSQKFGLSEQESSGEVQASNLSSGTCLIPVKPIGVGKGNAEKTCKLLHSGASCDATAVFKPPCFESRTSEDALRDVVQSSVSTSSTHISDVTLESVAGSMITPAEMAPSQNSESNESSKELKLNPKAKSFSSPSYANPKLPDPSAVPAVPHIGYMEGNANPLFAVAGNQQLVTSVPFVQYYQPQPGYAGQYHPGYDGQQHPGYASQHHPGYASQHHPAQAVLPVYDPYSQAEAMTGQLGPNVYMQPDIFPALGIPIGRPSFTPHHVQQQGNVAAQASQLYVPQDQLYTQTGQQPFAVPSQVEARRTSSSFPPTRRRPGRGSNRP